MGPNGSGKSTLANTLLANPAYAGHRAARILLPGRGHHRAARPTSGPPAGMFLGFQHPEEIPGCQRAQLPAPGDGRAQGHPRPLGARGAHGAHGVDEAPRHGRPLHRALPQRGLLGRREEAQRDPADGADGARRRGARRDRLRSRHRRAARRRRRHRRGPHATGPSSASCSSRTTSGSSSTSPPTSCTCCSTVASSPPAAPSSRDAVEREGFDAFRERAGGLT